MKPELESVRLVRDLPDLLAITKRLMDGATKEDRKVYNQSEARLLLFRKVQVWVGFDGAWPVTLNGTHFGKKHTNVWEPYANWYMAYTARSVRRQGYARKLALYVRELAEAAGCVRLKSLAGSSLGLHLHLSLGDDCWAKTDQGMVVVDTPIAHGRPFPTDRTPMSARSWTDRTSPLTPEEALLLPPLKFD